MQLLTSDLVDTIQFQITLNRIEQERVISNSLTTNLLQDLGFLNRLLDLMLKLLDYPINRVNPYPQLLGDLPWLQVLIKVQANSVQFLTGQLGISFL